MKTCSDVWTRLLLRQAVVRKFVAFVGNGKCIGEELVKNFLFAGLGGLGAGCALASFVHVAFLSGDGAGGVLGEGRWGEAMETVEVSFGKSLLEAGNGGRPEGSMGEGDKVFFGGAVDMR